MMQCRDIDELLMDFLYQELDSEKNEAFRSHVDGCARCGQEIASLSRTRQALHALPEAEPSPAVTARLLHEAGKRAARAESGGFLGWLHRLVGPMMAHPAWAAAASLILVAGVAGFLSLRGKVTGRAQEVTVESAPASTPAAAAPRDLPADQAYATEPKPVRKVGESPPSDYAPKVPAPAVAQPEPTKALAKEKARADADDAAAANDRRRMGRAASAEEDLKLAKPAEKKTAPSKDVKSFAGDDVGGITAAEPPPAAPAEARDEEAAAPATETAPEGGGKREAAEGERSNSADKGQKLDQAKPSPAPSGGPSSSTLSARGYASPQEPASPPPPPPAPVQAQQAPTVTKSAAQNEVAAKKEPPEQELFRLAQKQASTGLCVEALGNRDRIARMNSEFYRKRVAGDPSLRACEEQQQRSKRPARQESSPALQDASETKQAN